MLVYLRDGSAQTILRAATLRQKLQIKLSTLPSHSILTPGRPVPVLTLWRQAPGRVATGVPIFELLVWLDPEKSRRKRDSNPGSSALEADALTTRPTRRSRIETRYCRLWTEVHSYNSYIIMCRLTLLFFVVFFFKWWSVEFQIICSLLVHSPAVVSLRIWDRQVAATELPPNASLWHGFFWGDDSQHLFISAILWGDDSSYVFMA